MDGVSEETIDAVKRFRYREAFHMSEQEVMNEPAYAIDQAFLIWSLDNEKVIVNNKRNEDF